MKIGICTSIENIAVAEQAGFDYIEPSVVSVAGMTDEAFAGACALVGKQAIRCEAFNVLFPGDIKVVGPEADSARISSHLKTSFERIAKLGAEVVVFGSGGARKCPDGWDMEKAVGQYIETARAAGDAAAKHGITIVIEPLNTAETNIITTVAEGKAIAQRVAHENVKLLADWYHVRRENEPVSNVVDAGVLLRHIHIVNSNGRVCPVSRDEDDYTSFLSALRTISYRGRMSIEGKVDDLAAQAPVAAKLLRSMVAEFGL